jgi:hypothetical protein
MIVIVLLAVIGFSGYNIAKIALNYHKIDVANEEIVEKYVYEEKDGFLLDFNLRLHAVVSEMLGLERGVKFLSSAEADAAAAIDMRSIAEPKSLASMQCACGQPYYQVFAQRNGFIPSLSIVDLLFNTGPEGLLVLRDSVRG